MKTRFSLSLPSSTPCRASTVTTWPAISPAVRLRCRPRRAVRQNWQFTAQPTCEETQMVARVHDLRGRDGRSPGAAGAGERLLIFLVTKNSAEWRAGGAMDEASAEEDSLPSGSSPPS